MLDVATNNRSNLTHEMKIDYHSHFKLLEELPGYVQAEVARDLMMKADPQLH